MWIFFKILLFGGTTALTPQPIDIGTAWITVVPAKPVNVITEGATLQVQVRLSGNYRSDVISRIAAADAQYPHGCVHARLIGIDGRDIEIENRYSGASDTETFLFLSTADGIPTDRKFARVLVSAKCELKGVKITWQNFSE